MNLDPHHLFEIYENFYVVKKNSTYYRTKDFEIPPFFKFLADPFFLLFKDEVINAQYLNQIIDDSSLNYTAFEDEGVNKTMLSEYSYELKLIKEMYTFCQWFKLILDEELTEMFIMNNESHFNFTISEAKEDILNVRSAIALMFFELTNNPIGYYNEKNDCLSDINI